MFAFVCWTPYQIFNAINFVTNDVENSKNNTDLYIYHEFAGADKISGILKQTDIFSNVYDVEIYDKKRVWYSKFNKIKRLLCPYSTIKKYLKADLDVRKKNYDTLVISGNNLFAVNLYNVIQDMKVYFIDDGIGTYFGDIRSDGMTSLYYIFNKIFHRGPMSYQVEKVYVNNCSICKTKISSKVEQLPYLSENKEVLQNAKKVFSYKENEQYRGKNIYLSQPYFEVNEYIQGTEEMVLDVLEELGLKSEMILRLHPRQSIDQFQGWNLDQLRNLWEIECVEQITDDSILFGGFSTAQFLPKILVNREPSLIFLYKIFYPAEYTERWDGVIASLKGLYQNPEKIFVPDNVEELKKIVMELKEHTGAVK